MSGLHAEKLALEVLIRQFQEDAPVYLLLLKFWSVFVKLHKSQPLRHMASLPMVPHCIFLVMDPSWFPVLIVFAWSLAASHSVTACAPNNVYKQERLRVALLVTLGTRECLSTRCYVCKHLRRCPTVYLALRAGEHLVLKG